MFEDNHKKISINTKNILFVCLGAFSKSKPTDLITEIQGRLPIQVSVDSLTKNDFKKILNNSDSSILKQITEMLKTEGVKIELNDEAKDILCEICFDINQTSEDTGARRLVSVLNLVLEDISFYSSEIYEQYKKDDKDLLITIDKEYIIKKCEKLVKKKDFKKYIC